MRCLFHLSVVLVPFCLLVGCDDNAGKSRNNNNSNSKANRSLMPTVGEPAPDIDGEDLDGNYFRLSDPEYKGKVVMLDFWATWCPGCVKFLPHGKQLVQRYKGKQFAALGINVDELKTQPKSGDLAMRNWADVTGAIARRWGVKFLPAVILIDHEGVVRKWYEGPPGPELDVAVEQLVQRAENTRSKE